MRKKRLFSIMAILAAFTTFSLESKACTTLNIVSDNNQVVNIMNMEWATNLGYTVNHYPSNTKYHSTEFEGLKGLEWNGRYRVIGASVKSSPQVMASGFNEEGLFGTTLFLPDRTVFQEINSSDEGRFIAPSQLIAYVTSNFSTVEEVKEALNNIKVGNIAEEAFYNAVPTMHWMVTDKERNSIVIEYTEGELKIFDNEFNAMTNSPTFDWHINNMRNYVNLTNEGLTTSDNAKERGILPTGVGTGTLGMPGDYTPTGRFVRAAFFAENIDGTDEDIMKQAVETSNALTFARGTAVNKNPLDGATTLNRTIYSIVANSETGEFLYKRYGDYNWQSFTFDDFDNQEEVTIVDTFHDWHMDK